MNTLKKKLGNKGGFTLIEMLIVVAIIAILIAISIPLINSALERARDATDQANERSAKAEAIVIYMGVIEGADEAATTTNGAAYKALMDALKGEGAYYDAENGNLRSANSASIKGYGKCTKCSSTYGSAQSAAHTGQIIQIKINPDATGLNATDKMFTITWVTPSGT